MYIRHYFESPFFIYHVACCFLSNRIQLVSSSGSFWRIFPRSEYFEEKEKDGIQSKVWVNIVDEVEQTNLNLIFSRVILVECDLALSWRSTTFLLLSVFLEVHLFTHCSCWDNKSAMSIWSWLKNSNCCCDPTIHAA